MPYFHGGQGLKLALCVRNDRGIVGNRLLQAWLRTNIVTHQLPATTTAGEPILDENGLPLLVDAYKTIAGLARPHEVCVWQVFPAGARKPANTFEDSHKVFYAAGDEHDQRAGHFNWSLKRASDYGADLVVELDGLPVLTDLQTERGDDLIERPWGRLLRPRLLGLRGRGETLLREDVPFAEALAELRQKIDAGGLSRG